MSVVRNCYKGNLVQRIAKDFRKRSLTATGFKQNEWKAFSSPALHIRQWSRCFSSRRPPRHRQDTAPAPETQPQNYISKFYLKVHPDLFAGEGESIAQQQNQESLATLNPILDYLEALNNGEVMQSNAPDDHNFLFYCRSPNAKITQLDQFQVAFKMPTHVVPGRSQKDQEVDYLNYFLRQLIVVVGVRIPGEVKLQWKRQDAMMKKMLRPAVPGATVGQTGPKGSGFSTTRRARSKTKLPDDVDYSEMNGDPEFHEYFRTHHGNLKPAPNAVDVEPNFTLVPAMQNSDLIWFTEKVGGAQRMTVIWKFTDCVQEYYDEMRCNEWIGTPVCFHTGKDFIRPMDGAFVVPCEFGVPELVNYFQTNVDFLPQFAGRERPGPPPSPHGTQADEKASERPEAEYDPFQTQDNLHSEAGFWSAMGKIDEEFDQNSEPIFQKTRPEDFRAEKKAAKKRRKEYRRRKRLGLSLEGYEDVERNYSRSKHVLVF